MDSLEDDTCRGPTRNPAGLGVLSLIIGVAALFLAVGSGTHLIGAGLGAAGLAFGGYAVNYINRVRGISDWKLYLVIGMAGLLLAMIGFILGFSYGLSGSL